MQIPQEIINQVLCLHIQGRTEQEIGDIVALSQDQVQFILSDQSLENQKALSYLLAVKYGKNGRDMNEFLELNEAKKILFHQGVLPNDALAFITDLAEFSQTTGLGAGVFVPLFGIYHKFSSTMGITNYRDIQKRSSQALSALGSQKDVANALQQKYELLR